MRKTFALVANESAKLWGQIGFRVIMIILAAAIVFVPIGMKLFELVVIRDIFGILSSDPDGEYYLEWAEEERASGFEIYARYYEAEYQIAQFYYTRDISPSSPEYHATFEEYHDLCIARLTMTLFDEGNTVVEVSEVYSLISCLYEFLVYGGFYDDVDEQGYLNYDYEGVISAALEDKSSKEWLAVIDSEIDKVALDAENFSIKGYYTSILEQYKNYLSYIEDQINALEDELEKAPLSTEIREQKELALDYNRVCKDAYADICRAVELLIERESEYGGWEFTTALNMVSSAVSGVLGSELLSVAQFEADDYYTYLYDNYEEYADDILKTRERDQDAIKLGMYSLEHSIPLPGSLYVSTKTEWSSQFVSLMELASIIFICYAGITVAQEYSSGTIRLLLIKPCKRSKIITSKLMTLALWWIALALSAACVLLLMNVILFGFSDVMVSDLVLFGEHVLQIPSFLGALCVMFEETFMAFVYMAFAVLFAIITRKAVLAVAAPLALNFLASTVQSITLLLYSFGIKFVAFTPFMYLDFAVLRYTLDKYYMPYSGPSMVLDLSNSMSQIMYGTSIVDGGLSPWLGFIYMGVALVGVVWLAYGVFRKQKI